MIRRFAVLCFGIPIGVTCWCCFVVIAHAGQWTEQTAYGPASWYDVMVSADGTKLITADYGGGYVYLSTDGGVTATTLTAAGTRSWYEVAISEDGQMLAVAVAGGYIYTSSNGGSTWTERTSAGNRNWWGMAMSSDGNRLTAIDYGGSGIYTSADGGANWTVASSVSTGGWPDVAMSDDGSRQLAASPGNGLYISDDYGVTWTEATTSGARSWFGVTVSADGTHMAATVPNGYIYTSDDGGATWQERTSAGSRAWQMIDMSADGQVIIAAVSSGYLYLSEDGGDTWTEQTQAGSRGWWGVSISASGTVAAAVPVGGHIWTYDNSPAPIISNIAVSAGVTRATITWQTDVPATSRVAYGLTSDYGATTTATSARVTNHSVVITGLTCATTYHYKVISVTGEVAESTDQTFTTSACLPPPVISNVTVTATTTEATIRWTTDVPSNSTVEWGLTSSYGISISTSDEVTSHELTINVTCGTTYHYRVLSSSGSTTASGDATFLSAKCANEEFVNRTLGSDAEALSWSALAMSSDGEVIVASEGDYGNIWVSADGGGTWVNKTMGTAAEGLYWAALAVSDDGQVVIGAEDATGNIWISTDGGTTWTDKTTGTAAEGVYGTGLDVSSDGTIIIVTSGNDGGVWTSTDGGITWELKTASDLANNFSARWLGTTTATTTDTVTFSLVSDDGARLYLNGQLVIDEWQDQAETRFDYATSVTAGQELSIIVEYYEFGGYATIILLQNDVPLVPDSGFSAAYFTNKFLNGSSTLNRTDNTINFRWTDGSPFTGSGGLLGGWSYNPVLSTAGDVLAITNTSDYGVWISTDGGSTWTNSTEGTDADGLEMTSLAISASGTVLVSGENTTCNIWISTDGGSTWTNSTEGTDADGLCWNRVVVSDDGQILAATDQSEGNIWISTNGGETWADYTTNTDAEDLVWPLLAISGSGLRQVAAETSTNNIWTRFVLENEAEPDVSTTTVTRNRSTATRSLKNQTNSAQLRARLQERINELQKLIRSLSTAGSSGQASVLTRDLEVGMSGADVTALQQFLISANTGPQARALGAVGATGYFGRLTQAALAEYQQAHGITPAQGYFGPRTRGYMKVRGLSV